MPLIDASYGLLSNFSVHQLTFSSLERGKSRALKLSHRQAGYSNLFLPSGLNPFCGQPFSAGVTTL